MIVRRRPHEELAVARNGARLLQEQAGGAVARQMVAVAAHGDEQGRGRDGREIAQEDAALLLVGGDAARHQAEDELRGRDLAGLRPGREVERDRHAGRMADEGDALPVGLGVLILRQGCESALDQVFGEVRGIGRTGAVHVLEAREEHEMALAGEMVDPAAVEAGIHRTPGMQEDHHRTRLGWRVVAMEDEGSGTRRADGALDHLRRRVVAPAGPLLGLLRRRGRTGRWGGEGDAKEQKGSRQRRIVVSNSMVSRADRARTL